MRTILVDVSNASGITAEKWSQAPQIGAWPFGLSRKVLVSRNERLSKVLRQQGSLRDPGARRL